MSVPNTLSVAPVEGGWVVMLADGRELARFSGPDAKRLALRYVASSKSVRRPPPLEMVRRAHQERGGRGGPSSRI